MVVGEGGEVSASELLPMADGDLRVQLSLAQTALMFGQTREQRADAMEMIDALKAEIAKREVVA